MYIHNGIVFEWDEKKDDLNQRKHGIAFVEAEEFDWYDAVVINRTREKDGEERFAAIGYLYNNLHTIVFTKRGVYTRIISFRRANKTEECIYEKTITTQKG